MKSSVISSSQPRAVSVVDFNNDGQIDVVEANSGTNTIGVFILDINGTIINQQIYSTGSGSRPCSVVVTDLNQDGYVDIAVANNGTNNIGIFINNGNGTFRNQQMLSTGSFRPSFLAVGDFNNDNHSDIAAVYYGTDNIGIHLANNDGTFQTGVTYSTGYDSFPYSLAIGDVNHDKQLDIVVANYGTNNIGIFLGYGNGAFTSQQIYTTTPNSHPTSVTLGDFNQDNQLDILVSNYGIGSIGLFLNQGNGTFAKQILHLIDSQSRLQFITVGYLNMDKYLDVVIADSENDRIYILPGYTDASFSTLTAYDSISGSHPSFVAIVDFDKDNQSDLIVANYGTNNIGILCGYSSKPSVRQTNYFVGSNSRSSSVVIYDFNKDGKLDAAVNNLQNNDILIFNGIDNGKFVRGDSYSTGDASSPKYIQLGDLNNDNRMDMVVVNLGDDSLGVFFGNEDETFGSMKSYSTGISSQPWFAAFGDFNNDTYLDIVSVSHLASGISIFLNDGNGNFSDQKTYSTGANSKPYSVAIGNLNNDSYLDLVVANPTYDPVGVFLGYGNGSFGVMTTYPADDCPEGTFMIVLADLNRDNYLDIIVTCSDDGNVLVYLGIGNGTFRTPVTLFVGNGTYPNYVYVVDLNNDQHLDFATTCYQTSEMVIFYGDGTGNFTLARRYSTGDGSSPYALTVIDLNNDKQLEYVVTYFGTGYLAVLTEYYAAEFTKQFSYNTGSAPHPYSLANGDFNNDNQSDVVVVNSDTDNINILFGLNNGLFMSPLTYSIGSDSSPQYVITGDINKDNHLDIITLNSKENTISIIMNYGNGSFGQQMKYSTGSNSFPTSIVMGDLNNDNRNDFVITNKQDDSIGIFLGFDYTSFQNEITYSINNTQGAQAVTVSDFNNDKYLDIAVVYWGSWQLAIFLGHSDGNFSLLTVYSTGSKSYPFNLVVDDFNKDNHVDIAIAYPLYNSIGIFLGFGNGSFADQVVFSTGTDTDPYSLAVGDLNNDNRTDIVSINRYVCSISILIGNGMGNFTLMEIYSTGNSTQPYEAAIGDLNNDGNMDIVVCNHITSTSNVFLGYGNGSFQAQVFYFVGYQSWPSSIILADFNNDSQLDVAVVNYNGNNVGILLGLGDGTFDNVSMYSTGDGTGPISQTIGDFNNDKILDIAVVNYDTSTTVILFGFGDGTFLLGTSYSTGRGSSPYSIASGDFNQDGQLDVVVVNLDTNNFGIFLAYGRETFASMIKYQITDGSQPHSVVLSDSNHDGWLDIIVANYGSDNIGILFGLGNAIFSSMITYSTGINSAPYSLAITDFNHDNHSDIVVTNSETNNFAIFHSYSNGTFALTALYSTDTRSRPYTVTVGDLNNDNYLDIIIANSGTSNIFVLYGYANGAFGNETSYPLGYQSLPYSIALTDLNQDGRMDMVIASYGTNSVDTLVKMCI
ncbi:unnamed protein product [Adineta steineri]|uniref:FG-GAP repeat protein n=1 Tax=Adineta steineri TaxID=433720 RepID=A0A814FUZ3_9BILA|nr:unnamed protein product [Adineta steineri]CAF3732275.1 unnamed protein product [Adineta steineri]